MLPRIATGLLRAMANCMARTPDGSKRDFTYAWALRVWGEFLSPGMASCTKESLM